MRKLKKSSQKYRKKDGKHIRKDKKITGSSRRSNIFLFEVPEREIREFRRRWLSKQLNLHLPERKGWGHQAPSSITTKT